MGQNIHQLAGVFQAKMAAVGRSKNPEAIMQAVAEFVQGAVGTDRAPQSQVVESSDSSPASQETSDKPFSPETIMQTIQQAIGSFCK